MVWQSAALTHGDSGRHSAASATIYGEGHTRLGPRHVKSRHRGLLLYSSLRGNTHVLAGGIMMKTPNLHRVLALRLDCLGSSYCRRVAATAAARR